MPHDPRGPLGHHPGASRFSRSQVSLPIGHLHGGCSSRGCGRHGQQPLRRLLLSGLGQNVLLLDEERGVGCDDAIPDAQFDDRVNPLRPLAVQSDLRQEMADLARGPQTGDEVVTALRGEGALVDKLVRGAVRLTRQRDADRART